MSSGVLHCPHHTVSTRPSAYSESTPIFLGRFWTCCGYCGVISDSDLAFLQLALASKVHNRPQDPQTQANYGDLICGMCCCRRAFPSSLVTQPLELSFVYGPASACRGRSLMSVPEDEHRDLLEFTCSVGLGREGGMADIVWLCEECCCGLDLWEVVSDWGQLCTSPGTLALVPRQSHAAQAPRRRWVASRDSHSLVAALPGVETTAASSSSPMPALGGPSGITNCRCGWSASGTSARLGLYTSGITVHN